MTSVRFEGIDDFYDVVVIGSGLGGLTGANYLAKAGYKVLLLEQHYQLGGLATWFKRKGGYIFDISLHGFPYGMVKSCKRYWGKDIADSIIQLKDIRFSNPEFELQTTYDKSNFTELLTGHFNVAPETVDRFFEDISNQEFFFNSNQTTGELIDAFFPGRGDIKRFLLEPIAYANGSSEEDPALVYSIVFSNFMKRGIFTFQGGTDQLIKRMVTILEENGVTIKRRISVDNVLTEQVGDRKKVVGVRLGDRTIRCNAVVSNSNLKRTIFGLLDSREGLDPKFIQDAEAVRLNNSSCQVYLGIKKGETIPHVGDLLFVSEDETFSSEKLKHANTKSHTFSFYYPEIRPHLDPPRYSIVASSNAHWDDWKDLTDEAYEQRKTQLIENTLISLEKYIPGVRDKIGHIEAATPRTINHFTHHWGGASFGTKHEGLAVSQALPEQVSGLYHAGSVGIIMSGWLGTINYGVITANKVEQFLSRAN
jgi:all-trans-retinol 13,14-reductase